MNIWIVCSGLTVTSALECWLVRIRGIIPKFQGRQICWSLHGSHHLTLKKKRSTPCLKGKDLPSTTVPDFGKTSIRNGDFAATLSGPGKHRILVSLHVRWLDQVVSCCLMFKECCLSLRFHFCVVQ